jgi:hypothetical protein
VHLAEGQHGVSEEVDAERDGAIHRLLGDRAAPRALREGVLGAVQDARDARDGTRELPCPVDDRS